MELRVHVEHTVRIVCGLTDDTTVREVILALAQALKQTGRFYLVECWSGGSNKWRLDKQQRNSSGSISFSSSGRSRARVMSPAERPVRTLKSYMSLLDSTSRVDDLEFHLVRTPIKPTSNEAAITAPHNSSLSSSSTGASLLNSTSSASSSSPSTTFNSLLNDINRQQYLLNEQSVR